MRQVDQTNPVPRAYAFVFAALPLQGVSNIHHHAYAGGIMWFGAKTHAQ
jgi:hypothetical protein